MKAVIFREKINIKPKPRIGGFKIWVKTKKPLDEYSENKCYADICPGQKIYDLPCERKNIIALYIK